MHYFKPGKNRATWGFFFPGRSCTSQSCINNRVPTNERGTLKAPIMPKNSQTFLDFTITSRTSCKVKRHEELYKVQSGLLFVASQGKVMAKGIRWRLGPTAFHTAADHLCRSISTGWNSLGLLVSPKINGMTEKKTLVSTNSVLSLSFPLRFPEN